MHAWSTVAYGKWSRFERSSNKFCVRRRNPPRNFIPIRNVSECITAQQKYTLSILILKCLYSCKIHDCLILAEKTYHVFHEWQELALYFSSILSLFKVTKKYDKLCPQSNLPLYSPALHVSMKVHIAYI